MSDAMRVRCLGDELTEYAAGRLPLPRQWAWDRHLVTCRVCAHAVDEERRLRSALAGVPSMPGDLRSTLLALGSSLATEAPRRPVAVSAHHRPLALLAPSAPACHRSPLRATVVAAAAAGVSAAAAWSLTVIGAPLPVRTGLATPPAGAAGRDAHAVHPLGPAHGRVHDDLRVGRLADRRPEAGHAAGRIGAMTTEDDPGRDEWRPWDQRAVDAPAPQAEPVPDEPLWARLEGRSADAVEPAATTQPVPVQVASTPGSGPAYSPYAVAPADAPAEPESVRTGRGPGWGALVGVAIAVALVAGTVGGVLGGFLADRGTTTTDRLPTRRPAPAPGPRNGRAGRSPTSPPRRPRAW